MSTDLVRQGADLVPLEQVEEALGRLVEEGNTDALGEGRARADAYAIYERRRGAKERADYFGRVKVMAEGAIGAIDLQHVKQGKTKYPPLVVGGKEVPSPQRGQWRGLGQGWLYGMLDAACDAVQTRADQPHADSRCQGITTYGVLQELRRHGVGFVDRVSLLAAVKRSGRPVSRVADEAGVGRSVLWGNRRTKRVAWDRAVRVCAVIEVDPRTLKLAPPRITRTRRRLLPARALKGGRWDRAYSSHRKTMEEIFAITGESGDPDLWAHLHAVEDFLKRRV